MSRPCKKCESTSFRTENVIFKNGTEHIARYCQPCGAFNDYAAKEIPPGMFVMPFGKHQGKSLQWIVENDRRYAAWARRNLNRKSISKRLSDLLMQS